MKTINLHSHVLALSALMMLNSSGGEVLLHIGPLVSIPTSSFAYRDADSEDLTFEKQFHVSSEVLSKAPAAGLKNQSAPVSAARAIELASQSVYQGQTKSFNVRRLELLISATVTSQQLDYYLIEMEVNGSTEHRIVLMDGSVIKPTLKKVEK